MKRLSILAPILVLAISCSDDKGPRPEILSVTPDTICTGCGDSTLVVEGNKLTTAVNDALLEAPSTALPRVFLISPDDVETEIPSDGVTLANGNEVQTLTAIVPMDLVPPTEEGEDEILYDLRVKNPGGRSTTIGEAVRVVPPDDLGLLSIEPPFGWDQVRTAVTITGSGWFASTPTASMRASEDTSAEPVALENVAFIDESTITAVVPAGLPTGPYDVTVNNPPLSEGYGTLPAGFSVVSLPVPSIAIVLPGRGTTQNDVDVSILGDNFRDPVRVELIDENQEVAFTADSISPVSQNQIDTAFPTKTQSGDLPTGAYLVRVTNLDEETYSTWSSFLVTNPAGNLNVFEQSAEMLTGRRMLAGTFAHDNLGNRYVYAIGGDTGAGEDPLDTVEISQLSLFGALGPWREQGNRLNVPRVAPAAVSVPLFDQAISQYVPVKTYLYVIGGLSDDGTVLDSVERAIVLSPGDAPIVSGSSTNPGGGSLSAGTWYYKVSAVLPATDPDNPGGETLASEEVVVVVASEGSVTLTWSPEPINGQLPVGYRIYRTDEPDGVSQMEHLIQVIEGNSFTDSGEDPGDVSPLFPGATGTFVIDDNALSSPRWGHRAVLGHDNGGTRYVHVLGGKDALSGGVLDTVERSELDADGLLDTFSDTDTVPMTDARAFFDAVVESSENVATYPLDGTRIWVMGGVGADGSSLDTLEESDVTTGGGNAAWTTNDKKVQSAAGIMAAIANEKLFCLGGASSTDDTTFDSVTANGRDTEFDDDGYITGSINSTANSLLDPRALGVSLQGAGFIYFVGGTSNGTDAVSTTERTF